ncbi:MAG: protein-export membrane protein SecF [Candidatus Doudnabacteria bacterium RIFCSPLOWO2_02_FULL_49_13]|uniref:Protein-export membrane protein SecF n=1 Tax=Candidatus Doudnabacteria bacterium RIFCSPHIGHO2_12_FULL_48_16 TaxID=1817838 RepID=A0A1F5PKR9_9BACT|nr:MAG: protein-export membrane protein SecF [Candidatus Doudnabacteria bacterium RIFCSPHIGHO2_02_FULL_49_24]OGE89159.1 MAG: protein-export membrane protein SecF [Candidatus Doudnabacteria bacterium RIFCSPHIGHO2_01_FULL_50_67]OGE90545.1 MAG: protein-export membrane protein SecF [Candidatus Doudnabacteria bacterium RIFCSPHIGHO2_12_FULL_48_16]OGE97185.1 MAG: protein-export membrane protein SecF [Candidatus Doudnabacteria bacterium RIFCSPLOWO2_01_FULL_49_40]OGF02937.1 MAG: protein-export membrane 
MFNIMRYYKFWFVFSVLLLLAGVVSLALYGLKPGIDFRGGTLTQISFEQAQDPAQIGEVLKSSGFAEASVQPLGDKSILIRTQPQDLQIHKNLLKALSDKYGQIKEDQYTSIGPVIGKELRSGAFVQLILVSLGIILYIAYAFRKVSKPVSSWRFGIAAIVALIHDLFILVGAFSLLGHFWGVEIDSLFVTAVLTVLGFSVHDTIVVFDRIRENLRLRVGQNLSEIINNSINQTLIRSINTSLTVIFVLTALLLFGGESIHNFVLALLIGIVAGTYSSIFIASPILIVWHNWEVRRRS